MFDAVPTLNRASEAMPEACSAQSLDIFESVEIKADARRVLYALAMPEYMEAWLDMPEIDRIECHPCGRSFDRFRITLYASAACKGCIHGECVLSRPDKITYLWERSYSGACARSTVEICLKGRQHICSLRLRHSGFQSSAESEWHSSMWHRSLEKLCGLMEGSGLTR